MRLTNNLTETQTDLTIPQGQLKIQAIERFNFAPGAHSQLSGRAGMGKRPPLRNGRKARDSLDAVSQFQRRSRGLPGLTVYKQEPRISDRRSLLQSSGQPENLPLSQESKLMWTYPTSFYRNNKVVTTITQQKARKAVNADFQIFCFSFVWMRMPRKSAPKP